MQLIEVEIDFHDGPAGTDYEPDNLQLLAHGEHTRVSNSQRDYQKGYKLKLSPEERMQRSVRAVAMGLSAIGNASKSTT